MAYTEFWMTTEEAVNTLKKAPPRSEFALFVWMRGYSMSGDVQTADGDISGMVMLSRGSAVNFAKGALRKSAREAGVKLRITKDDRHYGKNGKTVTLFTIC